MKASTAARIERELTEVANKLCNASKIATGAGDTWLASDLHAAEKLMRGYSKRVAKHRELTGLDGMEDRVFIYGRSDS